MTADVCPTVGWVRRKGFPCSLSPMGLASLQSHLPMLLLLSLFLSLKKVWKVARAVLQFRHFCLSWGSHYPAWQRSSVPPAWCPAAYIYVRVISSAFFHAPCPIFTLGLGLCCLEAPCGEFTKFPAPELQPQTHTRGKTTRRWRKLLYPALSGECSYGSTQQHFASLLCCHYKAHLK